MVGNNGINAFNNRQTFGKQVSLGKQADYTDSASNFGGVPDQSTFNTDMFTAQGGLDMQQGGLDLQMSGGINPQSAYGGTGDPALDCLTQIGGMVSSAITQLTGAIQAFMANDKSGAAPTEPGKEGHEPGGTEPEGHEPGGSVDGPPPEHGPEGSENEHATPEGTENEHEAAGESDAKLKKGFKELAGDGKFDGDAMAVLDGDDDGVVTKDELDYFKELATAKKKDAPDETDDPEGFEEYDEAKNLWKALGGKSGGEKFLNALKENMEVFTAASLGDADEEVEFNGISEDDISEINDKFAESGSLSEVQTSIAEAAAEDQDDEELKDVAKLKEWVSGEVEVDEEDKDFNRDVKREVRDIASDIKSGDLGTDGKVTKSELSDYLSDKVEKDDLDEEVKDAIVANFDNIAKLKGKDAEGEVSISEDDIGKLKKDFKTGMSLKQALHGKYTDPDDVETLSSDPTESAKEIQSILDSPKVKDKADTDALTAKDFEGTVLEDPAVRHMIEVEKGAEVPLTKAMLATLKKDMESDDKSLESIYADGVKQQKDLIEAMEYVNSKAGDSGVDITTLKPEDSGLSEDAQKALKNLQNDYGWMSLDGTSDKTATKNETSATVVALKKGITMNMLSSAGTANSAGKDLWKETYGWDKDSGKLEKIDDYKDEIPELKAKGGDDNE